MSVCVVSSKSGPAEKKVNATAEALEMSLKYNFVTPLTSMVVTKPEADDAANGPLIADKLTEGRAAGEAEELYTHIYIVIYIFIYSY